jgi:hypothetical protein
MAGPMSGQEEAVPSSLTEGVGRGAPQTSRGTARSVPAMANALGLGLRPPSGVRGFGLLLLGQV